MTWTALYMGEDNNLLFETVNAPHGKQDAWDYITSNLKLNIIAIIPGNHDVFLKKNGNWKEIQLQN